MSGDLGEVISSSVVGDDDGIDGQFCDKVSTGDPSLPSKLICSLTSSTMGISGMTGMISSSSSKITADIGYSGSSSTLPSYIA